MTIETRPLGNSGISVAPLALGGNVFGWTADESTSFGILDAFVHAGGNMVDSADVYSAWVPGNQGGESETVIGHWLKRDPAKRERVVIDRLHWLTAAALLRFTGDGVVDQHAAHGL